MTSFPWAKKKKRRRRSEMRLGRRYEQVIAQEELPLRSVSPARVRIGSRGFSLLLAIGLASVLAYLFMSDAFYVFGATVHGNSLVSSEETYQSTDVKGFSIFFVEPHQVQKSVRSLPDVREATVQLGLPNRMIVEVTEREALVIWQYGQERYGVDDEGALLSLRGKEPSISITDLDSTPHQAGDQMDPEIVLSAVRYNTLLPQVREFDFSHVYGLSLINEDGWRIYLGNAEGAEAKVAVMKALVHTLSSQSTMVEFIDLRFPKSPYYRLAGE